MQTKLSKSFLNKYINLISSRCSFLYGSKYNNLINKNMKSIKNVYVTDELQPYNPMCYNIPDKTIYINKSYLEYDKYGKIKSFYMKTRDDQKHTLIHELLHACSNNDGVCGIPYTADALTTGLNEGITQMLSDDISGYVENKFLESYNDLKIAAKIIRTTYGNDVICDGYFKNSRIIIDKLNRGARDNNYYDRLNAKLSELNTIFTQLLDSDKLYQAEFYYYEKKLLHVYKDMIVNIVIPKLHSLSKSEKEKYLTSLMLDIGADSKIKNQIKTLLANFIYLNDETIDFIKFELKNEIKNLKGESEFISLMKESGLHKNKIYVSNNGTVKLLGSPNVLISSPLECKLIYNKIFEYTYPNFSVYEMNDYVKNLLDGKLFNINRNSVLDRRVIYCGIQKRLLDYGYNMLNDYTEFNCSTSIKPLIIPRNMSDIKFSDLKKIYNKYNVVYKVDGEKDFNYTVVDRKKYVRTDNYITKTLAYFINIWVMAFDNAEEAFSKESEGIYNTILRALKETYNNTNNFDLDYMEKLCVSLKSKKVLRSLMSSPIKIEWVYDFVSKMFGSSRVIQEFKSMSYNHRKYSNYDESVAKRDAIMILNK